MKPHRLRHQHLLFAARWLGLGGAKKKLVFIAAANALNVPHPTMNDGYKVLADFYAAFCHAHAPQGPKRVEHSLGIDVNSPEFLLSFEWRKLRMIVLKTRGARCECCGATPKDGVRMHVDHIKPRRRYPELALTEANLQILCEVCNHGKGSWDDTDWRPESQKSSEAHRTPVTRSGDGDGHTPFTTTSRLVRTKETREVRSTRQALRTRTRG